MLLDEQALLKTSQIDPTIEEWAKSNPLPNMPWDDLAGLRKVSAAMGQRALAMVGPPEPSITEEWVDIPRYGFYALLRAHCLDSDRLGMRDGFINKAKVFRPTETPSTGSPLIVYAFGGGFISGGPHAGTVWGRAWARLYGAVTVAIAYRLAPEHKFPVPMHDGIDNARWIAEHATELKAEPSKGFIIGGISAGATQAANMTLASISEPFAHPVTGQWLCVPGLMDENAVPEKYKQYFRSLEHNKAAPILNTADVETVNRYLEADPTSALRYPVLNKDVALSKLPPTFLQADGLDPLRDDALIYEEMLKEAGVKTRINLYPGCPHSHFGFMPGLEVATDAVADIIMGMGWLLGKEVAKGQALGALAPAKS